MEKYSFAGEEEKLRKKLRDMRIFATSLLVFMTAVFIIFKRYENKGLLFSSIVAFSEASMVGALADWFAVVALFRYPMGLKIIPHTAIIANNKSRIARALSNFVVSNFFTPEIIKAKLDKISVSKVISNYTLKNKDSIAKALATKLPEIINSVVDDTELENLIKKKIQLKIDETKLYPLVGKALSPLIEDGYHKPIVKGLLNAVYNFLKENPQKTMAVLGGINKTFAMPFIGDLVYRKILEFILKQVMEIDTNDNVEVNKLLLSALPKLSEDMKNSEELIEKGEELKLQLINSSLYSNIIDKLSGFAVDFKNSVFEDEQKLTEKISSILEYLADGLKENRSLSQSIDDSVSQSVEGIVSVYGEKVGSLIYDTMDGWETKNMVDKLEVQVGADLQYIRINGTVIGGLAGLVIHLVSQLF